MWENIQHFRVNTSWLIFFHKNAKYLKSCIEKEKYSTRITVRQNDMKKNATIK